MRPDSTRQPMTLRALRLWHWRKVLSYRATATAAEQRVESWENTNRGKVNRWARNRAKAAHQKANWHLGAVQVLNDVVDGTAEQDAMGQAKVGCGAALAPGQWWVRCGESDMGQTAPILCNVCDPKDGLKRAPQA